MIARDQAMRDIESSLDRPSAARVYDYLLGGKMNYAIDREFARKIRARVPLVPAYMRTSRQFLRRSVRRCVELGITQFVDVGSGLPTEGNVHDVADETRPEHDTRVVYVDNEPIALAHSTLLLADTADPERHKAIAADFLEPEEMWERVAETGVIDLDRPVGLVVNAVMHFIKDSDRPEAVLAKCRRVLAPGSLLVLSQMTNENPRSQQERIDLAALVGYYQETTNPVQLRTTEEFARFFAGWDLLPPGLVYAPAWHPDDTTVFSATPSESRVIGGVGRKP
ncbi:MAG TPA: SAM-dependent methyltransferase [Amycolatopsis sp.]|jgi:SAM-dependent methyltransferase|nr:SAM-dependent methyltransferase [Amycolatopsis sp.]